MISVNCAYLELQNKEGLIAHLMLFHDVNHISGSDLYSLSFSHSISQETNKLAKEIKNKFRLMSEFINSPANYRYDPRGSKLVSITPQTIFFFRN